MAYTNTNFKTKKALKDALADGQEVGVHKPRYATSAWALARTRQCRIG